MEKGILVAVDLHSEWLLAGWYAAYSLYNTYPIAFVNCGMSKKALAWAQEKGTVIQPSLGGKRGSIKPLILQLSPFKTTIWIELNCEVRSSLSCLFEELEEGKDMGLCLERDDKGVLFNSGVIVFKQNAALLNLWTENSLKNQTIEDKYFFTSLLETEGSRLKELKPIYNWLPMWGDNPAATILYWPIKTGKLFINPSQVKVNTF